MDKPVVVVSSEAYGSELGFELVLACRVTSKPLHPHDFDVVLSSNGKAICSDLRTIATQDLRERSTSTPAVLPKERDAIMATVRQW
jgi:mRNA-degrading endonuclease toxin of MazEF toxin-antitoxin module